MREGFWTGLGIGIILSLIINLFLIYGGHPRGMFWRIEDNKKKITELKTLANDNRFLIKGLTLEIIQ